MYHFHKGIQFSKRHHSVVTRSPILELVSCVQQQLSERD